MKSSPRYIKIVILLFCLACVNSHGPEDCIGQEIESDSFWVYEGTCLKNSELGLDEDGVRKITKEDQYKVFSECLPDNPEVDFTFEKGTHVGISHLFTVNHRYRETEKWVILPSYSL